MKKLLLLLALIAYSVSYSQNATETTLKAVKSAIETNTVVSAPNATVTQKAGTTFTTTNLTQDSIWYAQERNRKRIDSLRNDVEQLRTLLTTGTLNVVPNITTVTYSAVSTNTGSAYGAGKVIGTAATTPFSVSIPSGKWMIRGCHISTNNTSCNALQIWLFTSSIVWPVDNASITWTYAESLVLIGAINFTNFNGPSGGLFCRGRIADNNLAAPYEKSIYLNSSVLWFGLSDITAYTPISGASYFITFTLERVN